MFLALDGRCAQHQKELNKRERAADGEETAPESVWLKTDNHVLNSGVHKQRKFIYVNSSPDGVWLSDTQSEHTIVGFQSKGFFFYQTKDLNGENLGVFYSGE